MVEQLVNLFPMVFALWLWVKLFSLVLFLFYFVLSVVIIRQVDLMSQVLDAKQITPLLRTATIVHAAAVALLFFLALVLI